MSRYVTANHTHQNGDIFAAPENDTYGGMIEVDREDVECDCVLECSVCGEDTLPGEKKCSEHLEFKDSMAGGGR